MDEKLSEFREWLKSCALWSPEDDWESGMAWAYGQVLGEFDERFGA